MSKRSDASAVEERSAPVAASFLPEQVPKKHLYRVTDAMVLLSLGRSAVYELMRTGRLRSVKQGRTRLVPASAIQEYVELLEEEAQEDNSDQAA